MNFIQFENPEKVPVLFSRGACVTFGHLAGSLKIEWNEPREPLIPILRVRGKVSQEETLPHKKKRGQTSLDDWLYKEKIARIVLEHREF